MTIPQSYVEQNHLDTGARLAIEINGDVLKVKPGRQRPKLAELLAATPEGDCRAKGWDEITHAGEELF
ncbi:MAG: AbrB/MazE/SpoVT family DNA-binding domain-containing protein [Betaproteobacteria bacterium]|nr:AbrB/MazE/SpoVT family DNA-binding domain-containing protein [Betaproteobacteria bacterium]